MAIGFTIYPRRIWNMYKQTPADGEVRFIDRNGYEWKGSDDFIDAVRRLDDMHFNLRDGDFEQIVEDAS